MEAAPIVDGEYDVEVDVESDFACEAVGMEEIDVDAEIVLDGISLDVSLDDVAPGLVFIVGEEQGCETSCVLGSGLVRGHCLCW